MRLKPETRKEQILKSAVALAGESSYLTLTRNQVAKRASVSKPLITHYFGNLTGLKKEVMQHAVENELLRIIAQGLASNDKYAQAAPRELRLKAVNFIKG